MPLSDDDIQRIVRATKRNHEIPEYHIDPKEHYDQHRRLDRMLDAFEKAEGTVWKAVLGGVLFVGIVIAGLFAKMKGWLS